MKRQALLWLGAMIALACALAYGLFVNGLPADQARIAALAMAAIMAWATGIIAEAITALAMFTIAMLAALAPPEIVFAGLASSAFWLILSGLVIGAAIRHTGLGSRIAAVMANRLRSRNGHASWRASLTGIVLFGLGMAFLMPSAMGRIALMLPILDALATHLGYQRQSRGYHGLLLGGIFATVLPSSAILPANVPNNVLAGLSETILHLPLSYGDYLITHFPVLGLGRVIVLLVVLRLIYGDGGPRLADQVAEILPPISAAEKRLSVLLLLSLLLWCSDSLHHLSPAWIGMAAAVICLLPSLELLPPRGLQTINLEPVFYVGGIISLGAMLAHAGLGQKLAEWCLHSLPLSTGHPVANFVSLSALSTIVGILTTLPGVPAVLTPLTETIAQSSGLPAATILAAQVVGFSTMLLPYQAPPLIMAAQAGNLPRSQFVRLCLWTALPCILLLWPLDMLWLRLLGILP